ncbi:MAG TPA: zinc ribbon domain-containing protein [Candidatus Acidoferrum sp.]|nr:zinc ribbon domain-containing protein [Candidatus Acidoferrum sp.]
MSDAWNERIRLIRFRRKHERTRFREELRIIPKWLVWTCIIAWLIAIAIACPINFYNVQHHGDYFPAPDLANQPLLATLALAGAITGGTFVFSCFLFVLGYVYRDAKRRGMNPALWTLLVLLMAGPYTFIGLIVYLLIRDPLPYTCPQCSATVSARFNFCPNCKYNLHRACAHCQREVSDTDKFCPYCAAELTPPKSQSAPTAADSPS